MPNESAPDENSSPSLAPTTGQFGLQSSRLSSLSLGGALALIVPQAISAFVAIKLVLPIAAQVPALWAAGVQEKTWTAFIPAIASSLLTLGVASKSGIKDLFAGVGNLTSLVERLKSGSGKQ